MSRFLAFVWRHRMMRACTRLSIPSTSSLCLFTLCRQLGTSNRLSELLVKNKLQAEFGQLTLDVGLPVARALFKVLSGLNIRHELGPF